jgi:hypothetical protein
MRFSIGADVVDHDWLVGQDIFVFCRHSDARPGLILRRGLCGGRFFCFVFAEVLKCTRKRAATRPRRRWLHAVFLAPRYFHIHMLRSDLLKLFSSFLLVFSLCLVRLGFSPLCVTTFNEYS